MCTLLASSRVKNMHMLSYRRQKLRLPCTLWLHGVVARCFPMLCVEIFRNTMGWGSLAVNGFGATDFKEWSESTVSV